MKFCQAHWDELRAKIKERGLDKFVSVGGEEAARRLASGEFDPLMAAHNMLLQNALRIGGADVLFGAGCPLCALIDKCECGRGEECPFKKFTTRAADDALAIAKEMTLVGEA